MSLKRSLFSLTAFSILCFISFEAFAGEKVDVDSTMVVMQDPIVDSRKLRELNPAEEPSLPDSMVNKFEPVLLDSTLPDIPKPTLYERRKERVVSAWNKIIPRYSKLQFAGGMGAFSLGLGWDYGRQKQWETDIFLGYLPRYSGESGSLTLTLKQNYIPWKIPLGKGRFSFEPLETGLYINYLMSRNFWAREPAKYDGPYYRFATSLRFSAFLGQRITMKLKSKYALHKSLTFFYEISSNDLYIISLVTNPRYLNIGDILVLSFGLKFQFL